MPYQCITRCGEDLVAARGSSIYIFDPETGALLSTWKVPSAEDSKLVKSNSTKDLNGSGTQIKESPEAVLDENCPPAKRRKLSTEEATKEPTPSNGAAKQQNGSKKGNKRSDAVASALQSPAVTLLRATANGDHVIAVTGEDKIIRVFQLVSNGGQASVQELSQRMMPKRPCAIAITVDNSTIISADKFGDVYSLPLLIPETKDESLQPATPTPAPETAGKPFAPAANTFTVHSQRNRKALENQKRQSNRPAEKIEPTFEHKLLLGHVSMLTDLALVTLQGRNYILTADRDEHIRVSRGVPQAHIIEGFCLGHTEFISRLCIPDERPEVLISGGGEDELFVWDWVKGAEASRASLRELVVDVMRELNGDTMDDGTSEALKFTVSGITHCRPLGSEGPEDLIVVACEGVPALFVFLLTLETSLQHIQTLKVPGNVLDIVGGADTDLLMLSIDSIHTSGSTTKRREPASDAVDSLQSCRFQGRQLLLGDIKFQAVKDDAEDSGRLTNLLYGLENLRKREGDGREND